MTSFPQVSPPTPSSPIRATWPAHLILLDFTIRTILGREYRSGSSSLCKFLHSPVTSSLLAQILSSIPYSQTHSAHVSPSKSVTKFHTHTRPTSCKFVNSLFKKNAWFLLTAGNNVVHCMGTNEPLLRSVPETLTSGTENDHSLPLMPKWQINGVIPPFLPHAFRNLTSLGGAPTREKSAFVHKMLWLATLLYVSQYKDTYMKWR
jgi:hypothetical protein